MALSLGDLSHLSGYRLAALVLSVFLIFSSFSDRLWNLLPRQARPFPSAITLGLSGLPIAGSPATNTSGFAVLLVSVAVPFSMDVVPWERVPRWAESVAFLGSVAGLLVGRPTTLEDALLRLPIAIIVVLFIALYGSRVELLAVLGIMGLQFLIPGAAAGLTMARVFQGCILTSLAAIVGLCVHNVVTVMRRQQATIIDDHRQAEAREAWMQSVLENSTDAVVTIDKRGMMLSLNRAARTMFGNLDSGAIGRHVSLLVAPPSRAGFNLRLAGLGRRRGDLAGPAMYEMEAITSTGQTFDAEYSFGEAERDGEPVFIASIRDITDRKARSDMLEYRTMHDSLTGLPNRVLLRERLDLRIAQARRAGRGFALMMVDINDFKQFNDQLGHEVGDGLLSAVSERLTRVLRSEDTVARLGGDEFVVLAVNVEDAATAHALAAKLVDAMAPPFRLGDLTLEARISVGAALFPEHGVDGEALLRHADTRMYTAKRAGQDARVGVRAAVGKHQ